MTDPLQAAVLRSLAEHPHQSSAPEVSHRLGRQDGVDEVHHALDALLHAGYLHRDRGHYGLSPAGWRQARQAS